MFMIFLFIVLFYCLILFSHPPAPHNIFHTPMAQCSLFVLKVPLSTNEANQTQLGEGASIPLRRLYDASTPFTVAVQILSHTRTVVQECCKGDYASRWGKWEIRLLVTPKPLKRSSPKVVYVIRSWISTDMQNLVMLIKDVYSASFFQVLPMAHSLGPPNRFSPIICRRGSMQGCAFSRLEHLRPVILEKNAIFGPAFEGT